MKIRLEKEMMLVITPESYVEQIALQAWYEKNDVSGGGLLIEAYAEQSVHPTVLCTCFKNSNGTIEHPAQNCPIHNPPRR